MNNETLGCCVCFLRLLIADFLSGRVALYVDMELCSRRCNIYLQADRILDGVLVIGVFVDVHCREWRVRGKKLAMLTVASRRHGGFSLLPEVPPLSSGISEE